MNFESSSMSSDGENKTTLSGSKFVDNQMDSGFLSGSNLISSSSICEDEMRSRNTPSSPFENEENCKLSLSQNLDSGIDLSDRISALNLSTLPSHIHECPQTVSSSEKCDIPISSNNFSANSTVSDGKSKLAKLGLSPSHIEILKEIFKKDDDKDTQLHIAIIRGFVEVVWHITRLLPHQALLDIPNKSGRTPLHLAVAGGDACLARHLVVCGASPVAKNHRGDTPLHIACRTGDPAMISGLTSQVTVFEVVTARLSYPPNHTPGLLAADLTNYDGQTCIHICAQFGHKEALRHLSWYGADINAKDGKCGRTALHIAVESRDRDLVRFLVESCRAALNIQNYAGLTPYQLAFVNDAHEILSLLEELGAYSQETLPVVQQQYVDDFDLDENAVDLDATDEDYRWNESDLRFGGISQGCPPISVPSAVPVTSHNNPFNLDKFH